MEEGFHFHENTTVNTNTVQMQESWENKHFPCLCTCVVEKKSFVLQLRMKSQQFAFLPPHVCICGIPKKVAGLCSFAKPFLVGSTNNQNTKNIA